MNFHQKHCSQLWKMSVECTSRLAFTGLYICVTLGVLGSYLFGILPTCATIRDFVLAAPCTIQCLRSNVANILFQVSNVFHFTQHSKWNDCCNISDFKKVLIYPLNTKNEIINVGRSNFLDHSSVSCEHFKSYTTMVTDLYLIILGTNHLHYFCIANLVIHIPCTTHSFGLPGLTTEKVIISSGTMSHGSSINLLKMKHNILYIQNQSVPRSKHFLPRL